jgi:hypothetical protein
MYNYFVTGEDKKAVFSIPGDTGGDNTVFATPPPPPPHRRKGSVERFYLRVLAPPKKEHNPDNNKFFLDICDYILCEIGCSRRLM